MALKIKTQKLQELEEQNEDLRIEDAKADRIKELESALRESIKIATEREEVLFQEGVKRKQIVEKVLFQIFANLTLNNWFFGQN